MKRVFVMVTVLVAGAFFASRAWGQDHVELGIFGQYFRWSQAGNANLAGVGGRLAFNVLPVLQLEASTTYDFSQAFTEGFSSASSGSVGFYRSNVRMLDGLFGPKLQTNRGPLRLFFTAKGGADTFFFSETPATFSGFTSSVSGLRTTNLIAAFYPGGGLEAYLGPIGLRIEAGDEMYFSGGVYHNLRVTFGPSIRF
jgi:hypothetical protein